MPNCTLCNAQLPNLHVDALRVCTTRRHSGFPRRQISEEFIGCRDESAFKDKQYISQSKAQGPNCVKCFKSRKNAKRTVLR